MPRTIPTLPSWTHAKASLAGALVLLALSASLHTARAETFYVRIDGGDVQQCTGRSDAAYPGSGTAQDCAWNHPFQALAPDGTRRIAGGDTLRIGAGSYRIGQGAPGAGACLPANCSLATLPSGAPNGRTRVLGDASSPPRLWGAGGVTRILSLDGSSHVEVGHLEITDQDDCVYNHSNTGAKCAAVGGGQWGKHGVYARASSNVWLHDLDIHGLGHTGLWAGGLTDWTIERVRLHRNGRAGWDANTGTGSSNAGTITLRHMEIAWNGCGERWQSGEAWACWAQQTGGYGDGIGTVATGGQWLIEDSFVHHNTQDGLDLRFLDGADDTHATLRRVMAVGNAGNQVKVRGNALIENSVLIGDCGYFSGRDFMQAADLCRADGTTLLLVFTPNDYAVVRHNTITGQGWSLVGATEGDASGRALVQNNVLVGFAWFLSPTSLSRVQAGTSPAIVTHAGNLVWNVYANACPGDSLCGLPPRLTDMALPSFNGLPLPDSPAVDRVAPSAAVTSDFLLNPRPRGAASDIGAFEVEAAPACQRDAPQLTLSGATVPVPAGSPVEYTVTLLNRDSLACSATEFTLADVLPAGWHGGLAATSVTVAPGEAGNTVLTVTSPPDAAGGAHAVGVGAGSSADAVHTVGAGTTYTVQVAPPTCTPAAPMLALQGPTTAVPAGSSVDYTLVVGNRDSSACEATQFALAESVPAGWTGALAPSQLLLAPGAEGGATLTVTSPADAVPGGHGVGVGASSGESLHTASAGAIYTVQSPPAPCVRDAPAIGVDGPAGTVAAGTAVDYSITLTNRDSSTCGATGFTLARTVPDGWTGAFSQAQLDLAPGASGSVGLQVTSSFDTREGDYTIGLGVGSAVGPAHTANASATYAVAPPPPACTRATPSLSVSGPTTAVPAGSTVTYAVQVHNNDSAGCQATQFSLARSIPSGWTGVLARDTLTLAPQSGDSVALDITSSSQAIAGSYTWGVGVGSAVGAAHAAQAEAGYTVDVPAPTCTRVAPLATLDGPTTAVPAGTALTYTLNVANRDGDACAATTFALAATVPAGWSGVFATANLSLAAGASGSTTMTVTSAPNAVAGPHPVDAGTSSSAGAVHATRASATYHVSPPPPPCTRATPTLSLTGLTAAVAAGTAVDYDVGLVNNDSATCPATAFSLSSTVPAGWSGELGASGFTLGPGAVGSTTLRVTSSASTPAGAYVVGVGSSSGVGAVHVANAPASYTVAAATPVLETSLSTDRSSYARRATVQIGAQVRNNGVALAGVVVTFTMARPGGATSTFTATSGSDGFARTTYKVPNTKTALGTYTLTARWSFGGVAATPVSTTFTVL